MTMPTQRGSTLPSSRFPLHLSLLAILVTPAPTDAQHPPGKQSTGNVRVLTHIPTGGPFTGSDIDIEQELSRPYAYVPTFTQMGLNIVDLKDPTRAKVIYQWRI